jgi:O-antigen/teichoic acid export membrane protein
MAPAPQTLRSLFGDSLIFGLGRLTAVAASVVLVPIYTRHFSVADYGLIENLNVFMAIVAGVFSLALPEALLRHHPLQESEAGRRSLVATCSLLSIASGLAGLLAALTLAGWFGAAFLHRSAGQSLVVMAVVGLLAFLTIQFALVLALLRISLRPRAYLAYALAAVVSSLVLAVACVVWLRMGPIGPFVGSAAGTAAVYAVAVARNQGLVSFSAFDRALARRVLAFSLPLVPVALFLLVIRSSDRYFISLLLPDPLHQVGLYVTAEKVLAPLVLIGTGFSLAWTPFAVHAGKQADAAWLFRRAFGFYVALTSLGVVALSALSRAILAVFTPPQYHAAYVFVPVLGLYAAVSSLHYLGSVGLILSGRTRLGMPILAVAAACNLALNAVLIPRFGVSGAAWATVLSFLVYNALMFRTSEKLFLVGFPVVRGLVAYAASYAAAAAALGSPLLGVAALAAQGAVLLALGLLPRDGASWRSAWAALRPGRAAAPGP